jgi:integrase
VLAGRVAGDDAGDSTWDARHATRVCGTRPIRPRSRRSSPRCARPGEAPHGRRLRGLMVILWRAGLRILEALSLAEVDLDPRRGSLVVRHGKGGRRREVGMDAWGWQQLQPWLQTRLEFPVGPLFRILAGRDARATRARLLPQAEPGVSAGSVTMPAYAALPS